MDYEFEDRDDLYEKPRKFDYEHAREYLQGVIEAIYETGNIGLLQNDLEEVLGCFQMSLPNKEPKLTKKVTNSPTLQEWVTLNTNYLKSIA